MALFLSEYLPIAFAIFSFIVPFFVRRRGVILSLVFFGNIGAGVVPTLVDWVGKEITNRPGLIIQPAFGSMMFFAMASTLYAETVFYHLQRRAALSKSDAGGRDSGSSSQ